MKRYLITTADERSWKFDCPVLFLGEECRRYNRKHIWADMDAIVADPWSIVDIKQKIKKNEYVESLAGQILIELTEALNKIHRTKLSVRFWNIVLGHWLQRFIAVAYNRFFTLNQTLEKYKVSGTTVLKAKEYSLATADSVSFIYACTDDFWNHVLYSKILANRGDIELDFTSCLLSGQQGYNHIPKKTIGKRAGVKELIRRLINSILPRLSRKTDAFIIRSYLPIKEEFKLQLALCQIPQLWLLGNHSVEATPPNALMRESLALDYSKYEGFERYVRLQLPECIPTCYLEGYDNLVSISESLPWPKKPRFIFTSNNFDTDEVFKVWSALKVIQKVPYYAGQHGNNYGTHAYMETHNSPEIMTSDKFITWGWSDESKHCVPAFIFNTTGIKPQNFDPEGGLLLLELPPPHMYRATDNYYDYGLYQIDQFRFVECLPSHISRQLTVRLHAVSKYLGWCDEERWNDRSPNTKLDTGNIYIRKLICQNRLIVHSYDSTGILETLSLNIPTICFWRGGLDHLLPEAKYFYNILMGAGILFTNPEGAAEKIGMCWDNVCKWWGSEGVQDARKKFIWQYARLEKKPIRVLKKLFISDEKSLD